MAENAAVENGPIPLGAPRPRNAHEGPWNGLYPAGYKLVRRAPHACKGLALDRNEIIAETNAGGTQQENICDLYDDVTDVGAPSSPAPSPRTQIRNQELSRSLNTTERNKRRPHISRDVARRL